MIVYPPLPTFAAGTQMPGRFPLPCFRAVRTTDPTGAWALRVRGGRWTDCRRGAT